MQRVAGVNNRCAVVSPAVAALRVAIEIRGYAALQLQQTAEARKAVHRIADDRIGARVQRFARRCKTDDRVAKLVDSDGRMKEVKRGIADRA